MNLKKSIKKILQNKILWRHYPCTLILTVSPLFFNMNITIIYSN